MNEEMPIYDVLWDDIPEEELSNVLEATEAAEATSRFAEMSDSHIDKILDNAQSKNTKYSTLSHVKVI